MGRFAQWRGMVLARGHQLRGALSRAEEPDDPLAPTPSLNRLDALVEGFAAGQPVRWTVAGQPRPLPGPVDVVAYRIIEEALTNAGRHTPGAPVAVRLRYDATGITIEVRDEGAGPAPSGARAPGVRPGSARGTPAHGAPRRQVLRRATRRRWLHRTGRSARSRGGGRMIGRPRDFRDGVRRK
ncbi:sensor histidine kinase [Micromonospora tarensis]|uniref:histidine kinase n=1 Tax=Micromonospora tarensis TaxID=2806100 RepID=A0ABS1YRW1_9ACTN|nr:ATP-binding protein [Micromonospora tarensis]MBM0280017.1 hypothetical protein [Micromonospora tarensis]